MLFILLYHIICNSITFHDTDKLTQLMVNKEMNEAISEVFINNISVIGTKAFFECSNIENVLFQEPLILTKIVILFLRYVIN